MTATSSVKYLVAIILGLAYVSLAIAFWGWYVMNHPINELLLDIFARQGHMLLYRASIFAHDALVNLLLAAPAAVAFIKINALNNWKYVIVAVLSALVGSYWSVDLSALPSLLQNWSFWAGLCLSIFSLPIAYLAAKSISSKAKSR